MSGSGEPVDRFRLREVDIYRPYPDEIPWELLHESDPVEQRVAGYVDADYMRVAKLRGDAIGVYVVRAIDATRFELCNLVVARRYRNRGLGRWLLGHAIGLSETKGGREILVREAPLRGLFARTGFVSTGADLLLVLSPE